ncbi:MAG: ATP-binding protein [Nitrososphaerota archaeon]|nr:ATP-binding protein [Candidatus Geocrenenecus dongiae]
MKLRKKFTFIFVLYLMIFGLINAYILYNQISKSLIEELVESTALYLDRIQIEVLSLLAKGNVITLNNMVNDFKARNPNIAYMYIVDFDGNIVASTFTNGFPKALVGFNPPVNGGMSVKKFKADGSIIYDVSVPVYRGIGGEIHIGITSKQIEEKMFNIIGKIFLWSSLIVGIGTVSFFMSLTSLTMSMKNLENAIKKIIKGDYRSRVEVDTQDEIGMISTAFNRMLDKLEEEREKIRNYVERLRRLKNRYKMLVNSIQDGILLISSDGIIYSCNKASERIFNLSKSDIVNRKLSEIIRLDSVSTKGEVELSYDRDGETVYIKLFFLDLDKEGRRKIVIVRDITSDKAREEFFKMIRQYEKIAIIQYLIAGIIHKINTFLTRMMLGCELILSESKEELTKKSLERVVSNVMEIKHAIDDLLRYGRRIKINKRIIDVVEIVENSLKAYSFNKYNVKVIKKYNKPCKAYIDPLAIGLVIDNLIMNAIQAMPGGGTLTIEVQQDNSNILISIRDTGGGIPKEDLDKIFEPFYSKHKGKGGLGLGLTISQEIVKMHGGTIIVESELGKGSIFTIKLPRGAPFDQDTYS